VFCKDWGKHACNNVSEVLMLRPYHACRFPSAWNKYPIGNNVRPKRALHISSQSILEPANSASWSQFHLSPQHKVRASPFACRPPYSPPIFRCECCVRWKHVWCHEVKWFCCPWFTTQCVYFHHLVRQFWGTGFHVFIRLGNRPVSATNSAPSFFSPSVRPQSRGFCEDGEPEE
jgi:hypothetical protein